MSVLAVAICWAAAQAADPPVTLVARAQGLGSVLQEMSAQTGLKLDCDDSLSGTLVIARLEAVPLSAALEKLAWASRARVGPGRGGFHLHATDRSAETNRRWAVAVDSFLADDSARRVRGNAEIRSETNSLARKLGAAEEPWELYGEVRAAHPGDRLAGRVLEGLGRAGLLAIPEGRTVFSTSPSEAQRRLPDSVWGMVGAAIVEASEFDSVASALIGDEGGLGFLHPGELSLFRAELVELVAERVGDVLMASLFLVGTAADGQAGAELEFPAGIGPPDVDDEAAPPAPRLELEGPFEPTPHEAWFWDRFHRLRENRRRNAPEPEPGGEFEDLAKHEPMAAWPTGLFLRAGEQAGRNVVAVLGDFPTRIGNGSGKPEDVPLAKAFQLYVEMPFFEWEGPEGWLLCRTGQGLLSLKPGSRTVATQMLRSRTGPAPGLEQLARWALECGDEDTYSSTLGLVRRIAGEVTRIRGVDPFWVAKAYASLPQQSRLAAASPGGTTVPWASLPPGVAETVRSAVYAEPLPLIPNREASRQGVNTVELMSRRHDPTRVAPFGIPPNALATFRRGSSPTLYQIGTVGQRQFTRATSIREMATDAADAIVVGERASYEAELRDLRFFEGTEEWVEVTVRTGAWTLGPFRWTVHDLPEDKPTRKFAEFSDADRKEFERIRDEAVKKLRDG